MERRQFITAMAVAFLESSFLMEKSIAQGQGNATVANQASGSDGQVTQRTKTFGSFARLPAKTIRPEGWLRQYAQINADTWLLTYARSRDPELYNEYRDKRTARDDSDFTDYIGDFGADLVHYAHMLPDAQTTEEVEPWIRSVLACQEANGYLGGFAPEARWRNWLEVWTLANVLDALLRRYEVTGDKNLLTASERAIGGVIAVLKGSSDRYSSSAFANNGVQLVEIFGKLSMLTGRESYLNFGREYLYKFGKVQAYLKGGDQVVHNHGAMEINNMNAPVFLYEYAGDPQMLKASQAAWEMMQTYVSVAGAPLGGEALDRTGSRANSEHCDVIEWIEGVGALARMTGDVKYADAVERTMFNAYPAPKGADGWTLGYMHTPNQLVATEWSEPTMNNSSDLDRWSKSRQYYSSSHSPLCCNTNSARGIPLFVESMVAGAEDGLSFLYYGPCTVNTRLPQAGAVGISMDTRYPFEDEVRITLQPERAAVFPVQLRVPGWCVAAGIEVNGTPHAGPINPGTFATISRKWKSGDRIVVKFVNPVRLVWGGKPEAGVRIQCAAVERGPLVYVLRVPEQWLPFTAPDHGPGKEKDIKSYRLLPTKNAVWNYALVVDRDHPERDLKLTQLKAPKDAIPWDGTSSIGLSVRAKRVLNWHMEGDPEHPMTPGFPFNPMKCSEELETITLVPFGTARLRMTYLPIVDV